PYTTLFRSIVGSDRAHEALVSDNGLVLEVVAQANATVLRVVERVPEGALRGTGRVRGLRHLRIHVLMEATDGLIVQASRRQLLAQVGVAPADRSRLLRRRQLAVLEMLVESEVRHDQRL